MASEGHAVFTLIHNQLILDAPLMALISSTDPTTHVVTARIYDDFGVEGAPYPRVLITFMAGTDRTAVGGDRRFLSVPVVMVEALTMEANYLTADQIDSRFDSIIGGLKGTVGSLSVRVQAREREIKRVEITGQGERINHLGGYYRCWVSGQTP